MQIGNLRHQVVIQTKSSSKDSAGQDVHTWVDSSPRLIRSASIKPIKGQELVEARQVYGQTLVSMMLRYDPEVAAVTTDDRIVREDFSPQRIYAIHTILSSELTHGFIEFWCSEGLQDKY